MGLFDIFKKKGNVEKCPRGFYSVKVKEKIKITDVSVKLSFDIPDELKDEFRFIPGQYINLAVRLQGHDIRRSYSICSGDEENLAVGIKHQKEGAFSTYVLDVLQPGDTIWISKPMGNFQWVKGSKLIVAFAAGSGITPILSIAKRAKKEGQKLILFYGNKQWEHIMFLSEFAELDNVEIHHFLSQEKKDGAFHGRLSKENIQKGLAQNKEALLADDYFLCGPNDMIENVRDVLSESGVSDGKVHFEMFQTKKIIPTDKQLAQKFHGTVATTVIIDQEEFHFEMDGQENLLQKSLDNDVDAPYSCRGGVCQTCKCKIIEGSADMALNFTLSEKEIAQGYILSCQASPTSEKLVVSFDD